MYALDIYIGSTPLNTNVPIHGKITFGRGAGNTFVLSDRSVSRCHASLEFRRVGGKGALIVRDEGSTNGTYVNEHAIEEQEVFPGDRVRMGQCQIEVKVSRGEPFPDLKDDAKQEVVFEGDPFSGHGKAAERLHALHDLSQTMADAAIPLLLENAARAIKRGLDFDNLAILLDGETGLLACTCWNRKGPCPAGEVAVSRTILNHCLETARPASTENAQLNELLSSHQSVALRQVASALCAPLSSGGAVLGALYCTTSNPLKRFDRGDLQFLTHVAGYVAVALTNRRTLSQARLEAAKLEAILEGLTDGVLVCDGDFTIVSANQAAGRILARSSLQGCSMDEVLDGFHHTFDPIAAPARKFFEFERGGGGEPSYALDIVETFHATVSPVHLLEEDGWRHIICLRDVTQQRRGERLKSVLAGQLAHKLRTPLTILNSVSSLLADQLGDRLDPEMKSMLETGERNTQKISSLIQRFEEFSSLNLRHLHLESKQEVVTLDDLVDQAITDSAQEIERYGLEVHNGVERGRYHVAVDSERMVQCFTQLVQNAAKFAGPMPRLTITAAIDEDGLRVLFSDEGPGIPVQETEGVFGIFQQVDRENTGEVPGIGLGLWWTREVVHAHGGGIRILPPAKDQSGARLVITIPRKLVVAAPRDAGEFGGKTPRLSKDLEIG